MKKNLTDLPFHVTELLVLGRQLVGQLLVLGRQLVGQLLLLIPGVFFFRRGDSLVSLGQFVCVWYIWRLWVDQSGGKLTFSPPGFSFGGGEIGVGVGKTIGGESVG